MTLSVRQKDSVGFTPSKGFQVQAVPFIVPMTNNGGSDRGFQAMERIDSITFTEVIGLKSDNFQTKTFLLRSPEAIWLESKAKPQQEV